MSRCTLIGLTSLLVLLLSQMAFATPGDTLQTFSAPYNCPQGLTFDGSSLWNVDRMTDMIYKIDPKTGAVIDSIPSPAYVPRGLTWDGGRLWCVDAEEQLIYAINPATRIVEKTIDCPVTNPSGLAWDGKYLWIGDDGANDLHQISSEDGTTIVTIPAPSGAPTGLAYDGDYLWVADRMADMIYMVFPDNGDVILCFKAPGPHAWGLAWDGKHLWNADYQTDLISKLVINDGTPFARLEEKTQQVEFIHQVRNYGPDTVKTLDVYLAIPHDLNNQELIGEVTFSPEPTEIIADQWNQKVAHYHVENIGPMLFNTVSMHASARLYQNRYFVFPNKVGLLDDIPEEIRSTYLVDDAKFSMESEIIQSAVRAAVGDETNPYWMGRKIFNYVIEHMEYELAGGWNIAPTVLDRGNGSCSEYSFVYIAMCRAAGLPARYVGSIVVRGDDASYDNVFHRWVEIYLPNYGWLPVDPSGGDSALPSSRANAFGFLNNRYLITTIGGGGSEFLGWGYNANEEWTSQGRCKIVVEYYGEWTPANGMSEETDSDKGAVGSGKCE
ncbi:MAG: transglutaminase [candidate division Zixibacteria bacterium]|nr:transglutaminase [candidate division Zixibacteria bacterium]